MDTTPEILAPPWTEMIEPSAPILAVDTRADVCVIGAGIAGLTTAYLLALEGKAVVVLDATTPGSGQTGLSTAHLSTAVDDRYRNLERWHGPEGARVAAESHAAAIDRVEKIVADEEIACGFARVDGYLFCADGDTTDTLQTEYEAARRAGLSDVVLTEKLPALYPREWKTLRFPRQAQFDPRAYLQGLILAFQRRGGRIFGSSRVVELREGIPAEVVTDRGVRVKAREVVVATNLPFDERFALHTKHSVYLTHVIAGTIPSGAVHPALYWDTADPYHYVRLDHSPQGFDRLIVGGEDLAEDNAKHSPKAFHLLEEWARHHFPSLDTITHRWTGRIVETIDGLGFIGRNPGTSDNLYSVAGDSGMGITHGTLAAMLITDLIQGRPNAWEHTYRPGRMTLAAAIAFARENAHVARKFLHWGQASEIATEPTAATTDAAAPA
jgi:glycine/D-amino acid oxidase-like deaminating enzyme